MTDSFERKQILAGKVIPYAHSLFQKQVDNTIENTTTHRQLEKITAVLPMFYFK